MSVMAKRAVKNNLDAERLKAVDDALCVCIGILERERNGRGPENPETLKKLLEVHRGHILTNIGTLKDKTTRDEDDYFCVVRIQELVEKFDLRSLEEAKNLVCGSLKK
jgi:hypothetical protein